MYFRNINRSEDKMKTLIVPIIATIMMVGYISNIVKLISLDFKAPYKAEVIRLAGVLVPPVGVIVGYLTIKDGE